MNPEKDPISILFICSANKSRSPYAELYFTEECRKRGIQATASSAGLFVDDESPWGVQLEDGMVKDSDIVFAMEDYMGRNLVDNYGAEPRKVVVLGIPDKSGYKERIHQALEPYLNEAALRRIIRESLE